MDQTLYVITCISNPVGYATRYQLYRDFAKRMADQPNVKLYTVEMAFGDRPHVVTEPDNPCHLQLRSFEELWHKENMLNLMMRQLPKSWEYLAWVDADVSFSNPQWAEKTISQLQHYMIVQMFSHAIDLDPAGIPITTHSSFTYNHHHGTLKTVNGNYAVESHPGYAWAARREALEGVGGLFEHAILGAADHHMCTALIGQTQASVHGDMHSSYKDMINEWQKRCLKTIKRDIGYVPGTIFHYWHGTKGNRHYSSRWKILVDHQYNPHKDVFYDTQGLLQLNDERWDLRDDLRKYFRSRHEDSTYNGSYPLLP